jgi:hypothetical protein
MIKRLLASLLTILIAFDQLVQAIIRTPLYVITGNNAPSPRETISAWFGCMAASGWWIGRAGQMLINSVFGPTHCQDAAAYEKAFETMI